MSRLRLRSPRARQPHPLALRPIAAGVLLLFLAPLSRAASPLPPGTLPVPVNAIAPQSNIASTGTVTGAITGSTLTLTQDTARAVIPWQSFNIAGDAAVVFRQPDATSVALNRIGGLDPSIIQGRLSANGQVYLLNSNGIVFDRGAQVNTQSLVASSLDITDRLFAQGPLSLAPGLAAFSGNSGFVRVEAGAKIETARGGNVWLFAPEVENRGRIDTTGGQVVLASGQKIYLASSTDTSMRGVLVQVDGGGAVTNVGELVARQGRATLAGLAVNQSGRISATTSVTANGIVELLAQDTVAIDNGADAQARSTRGGTLVFGAGSITEVRPEASSATIADQQTFNASVVNGVGRSIRLQAGAAIVAPGGSVTLKALNNPSASLLDAPGSVANASRVWLDAGATIDVSGLRNIAVPMARNFVQVELRANELRDAPLQKDGPLRGKTVTVDIRQGTPLADVSGAVGQIGRTASERLAHGGRIDIHSEGDVVLQKGSRLDVSGGSVRYLDGVGATTRLRTASGRVVDIGAARPDQLYLGVVDGQALQRFFPGYIEGKDAGSISLVAPRAVLGATMAGRTVAGPYQVDPAVLPVAGRFAYGRGAGSSETGVDFHAPDVTLSATAAVIPADLDFATTLPEALAGRVVVSAGMLSTGGFGRLDLSSNGTIDVAQDVRLALGPRGTVNLQAQRIDVAGSLSAPGGSIQMATRKLSTAIPAIVDASVVLASTATLSTRGLWVNESPQAPASPGARVIDAGAISLSAVDDVRLARGSVLDVSGGARLDARNVVHAGQAGRITLSSNAGDPENADIAHTARTVLDGTVRGLVFQGGAGGKLELTSGSVTIGTRARGSPGELLLTPDALRASGFHDVVITGIDGLRVDSVLDLAGLDNGVAVRVLQPGFHRLASGTDLSSALLARPLVLPDVDRIPASVRLIAPNPYRGQLVIGEGAGVRVDPGGAIALDAGRQLTVLGRLDAPAGAISLTMRGDPSRPDQDDGFHADQSIWFGAGAVVSARGAALIEPDRSGWRRGDVLDGGSIIVTANKGYVVAQAGAVFDVSGTATAIDMPGAVTTAPRQRVVATAAGAITLAAREGVLSDATMRAAGGAATAAGGTLTMRIDRQEDPADPTTFPRAGYPVGERVLVVRASGTSSDGLAPGAAIDLARNGSAYLSTSAIAGAGFDNLVLRSGDAIRFEPGVALSARRSVTLDAPVVEAAAGARTRIEASHVALGNSDPRYQGPRAATSGSGTLVFNAQLIDLAGAVALRGIDSTALTSRGDIRLQGVLTTDITRNDLEGSLRTTGNLVVQAAQVYPTTLSQYRFSVDGTAEFRGGGATAIPLSAGGRLSVEAASILVSGTLRAPQGSIVLKGMAPDGLANAITLTDTALLSVAGAASVLFGVTQNGTSWFYDLGTRLIPIGAPPAKSIELDGRAVRLLASDQVDPGTGRPLRRATVDLSAGGDLTAWEFLPGPGGSTDLLAQPGVYAIVPGLASAFAPRDWANDAGSGLMPGDSVYLTGVDGLRAGTYALLPAHYALMPGAYAIRFPGGTRDMQAASNTMLADGSFLVAGYRTVAGTGVREGFDTGVQVIPGATIRAASEYVESRATRFFTDRAAAAGTVAAAGPADAGSLAIHAVTTLDLDGDLRMRRATVAGRKGRGGALDIAAGSITLITGPRTGRTDTLEVDADQLSATGASSVMVGGVRAPDGSGRITPVAGTVSVAAGAVLTAPEVLLVATDSITLESGARVEARGDPTAGSTAWRASGDGALLRAGAGAQAVLQRTGVGPIGTRGGVVEIQAGAVVDAAAVLIDATRDTTIADAARLITGAVDVSSGRIGIGQVPDGRGGLALTGNLLANLAGVRDLALRSYGSIDFFGDVHLEASSTASGRSSITLDTGSITGNGHVVVRAGTITLQNTTGSAVTTAADVVNASLDVVAGAGDLVLGPGAQSISGFQRTTLIAAGDVSLRGQGSLDAAGLLLIQTRRMTGSAGFQWRLGAGDSLAILGSPIPPLPNAGVTPGLAGQLTLASRRVEIDTLLQAPSGALKVSATDDVVVDAGATLDVAGASRRFFDVTAGTPGGVVRLASRDGDVLLAAGARIDVSGSTTGGDAGMLDVSATNGRFLNGGAIAGTAATGAASGRFMLDASRLDDLAGLGAQLAAGGFRESWQVRARTGDLSVADDQVLTARLVSLTADAGSIAVAGAIDASAPSGGSIALWAADGIVLAPTGRLDARGTTGAGGSVTVGTVDGRVDLRPGARIDVSGGNGGVVLLRAPRDGSRDVALDLGGTITGSRETVVEAIIVHDDVASIGATATRPALSVTTIANDVAAFMANAPDIIARLGRDGDATFHLRPGIEIRNASDLALLSDWNLFSPARAGGEPGMLTLRAGGDLSLNGSLSDGFSGVAANSLLQPTNSWSYRLVAGADLGSADPVAVVNGAGGSFSLAAGKLVRTGTGRIDIAAAGDVRFGDDASVVYTAGRPSAPLADFTPPTGTTANYPEQGGDVSIRAGRDVSAVASGQLVNEWLHRQGRLNAQGGFALQTSWWVSFADFRQTVGALGGGNVSIDAGRDIIDVSAAVPTTGRMAGVDPVRALPTVTGGGNLDVQAGGDILGGVYFAGRGRANLTAAGAIGAAPGDALAPLVASMDAAIHLQAGRGIEIQGVFNPTVVPQGRNNVRSPLDGKVSYFFTYGADTAVAFDSIAGNIVLRNDGQAVADSASGLRLPSGAPEFLFAVYPGSIRARAFQGDVIVEGRSALYPTARGDLEVLAGGSVRSSGTFYMADQAPTFLARAAAPQSSFEQIRDALDTQADSGLAAHSSTLLHAGDTTPVRIYAAAGDVIGPGPASGELLGIFAKAVQVRAAGDIVDASLVAQNLAARDVTLLEAGRDIVFTVPRDEFGRQQSNSEQVTVGGPGRLEVLAGRDIDLGNAAGLLTRGNRANPSLPAGGADLLVAAGMGTAEKGGVRWPESPTLVAAHLDSLDVDGVSWRQRLRGYLAAIGAGPTDPDVLDRYRALPPELQLPFAAQLFAGELTLTGRRASAVTASGGTADYGRAYAAIAEFLPQPGQRGDLRMYFSQLKTERGGDIDVLAPAGLVNAGLASPPGDLGKDPSQLGIVTVGGGSIRAFVRDDFLVNQSRVFTLAGGDILIWSTDGNIDAGRGRKGVTYAPAPAVIVKADGTVEIDASAAVSGSGIATLLTQTDLAPGDVDLYAPRGNIDAGDAGIRSSGNLSVAFGGVFLNATNVVSFGAASGLGPANQVVLSSLPGAQTVGLEAAGALAERVRAVVPPPTATRIVPVSYFLTVEVIGMGTP